MYHQLAVSLMGEPRQCSPPVWPSCKEGKRWANYSNIHILCINYLHLAHNVIFHVFFSSIRRARSRAQLPSIGSGGSGGAPLVLRIRNGGHTQDIQVSRKAPTTWGFQSLVRDDIPSCDTCCITNKFYVVFVNTMPLVPHPLPPS